MYREICIDGWVLCWLFDMHYDQKSTEIHHKLCIHILYIYYTYIIYIFIIIIYIYIYIVERERSGILDAAQAFGVYWPCEILLTSVVPRSTTKAGIETRLWSAVGAVSRWHFDAFWRQKEWSKTMSRMRVMVVWILYEFEWCRYDVDVDAVRFWTWFW
jgi:hypothetical protein